MSCRLFLSPSIYRTKNISILLLLIHSKRRWQDQTIYLQSLLRSSDSGIHLLGRRFGIFIHSSHSFFGEYISFLSWRNNDTILSWVRVDQDLYHFRSLEKSSESDTIPGKANRFLGKIADIILLWYDDASKYFPGMNALVIGQILDPVWYKHDEISSNITWKTNLRHILVICGSQGSRTIFEELSHTIGSIDAEFKIILGTLNQDMKALFDQYSHVEAIDWIESQDLLCILQDTDLVVTRWSATTLAELSTSSAHFIIIPLPDAMNNHQYYNALYYERLGHTVLLQSDISLLSQKIKSTLLLLWKHKK